jgi:ATP-dependent RNA helicase RhlE
MSFKDLLIEPRCLKILTSQKITEPTPIQAEAIPVALEGRDVMAVAQTGTGKTLAFGLPSLTRLAGTTSKRCQMLIITPTRELAHQVNEVLAPMARAVGLRSSCVYGGVGLEKQAQILRRGCPIVVATPGRLLDHIDRGNIRFKDLSILCLDEADRMLDMGFLPDIKRIMSKLPEERQTLMFSATFPPTIGRLAMNLQKNPVRVEVGAVTKPTEAVRQEIYTVVQTGKQELLANFLNETEVGPVLVFLRTKSRTDRVARNLSKAGFKAQAIHGGRTQSQRQRAIDGFREGRCKVLVATDVAARGLDVDGITHVVNYDVPNTTDDYIHRIGRTARASATGDAITFVTPEDGEALGAIEKVLGRSLPRAEWAGAVHVPMRSSGGGQRSQAKKNSGGYGQKRPAPRPKAGGGEKRYRARDGEQSTGGNRPKTRYGASKGESRPASPWGRKPSGGSRQQGRKVASSR